MFYKVKIAISSLHASSGKEIIGSSSRTSSTVAKTKKYFQESQKKQSSQSEAVQSETSSVQDEQEVYLPGNACIGLQSALNDVEPHKVTLMEAGSSRGKKGYDGAKADIWSCGVILYVLLAGCLPFKDDNIVSLYRKIYKGDFKCPPWMSPDARRLIVRMLDPNPSNRITISKIMECSWFKRKPANSVEVRVDEKTVIPDVGLGKEEKESLNAFHIISLSQGFNLSPLFEEKKREEKEEIRFATTRPASSVISRLEEAAVKAGKFSVEKSGDTSVRLQRQENGRKGKLAIAADIFPVTQSVLVVEVKKSSGDTFEYNQFCSKELRPALKDVVWTSPVAENSASAWICRGGG